MPRKQVLVGDQQALRSPRQTAGGCDGETKPLALVARDRPAHPDALIWPSGIVGTTYRADATVGTVTLTRRDGRWEGEAHKFPLSTATHFAPDGTHGFFVAHLTDDRFVAVSDRSAHRGQRVYWYDPLPLYDGRWKNPGFMDHDAGTAYAADGLNIGGPAPRPLDPYPLIVRGDRITIASLAECPPEVPGMRTWCRDAAP